MFLVKLADLILYESIENKIFLLLGVGQQINFCLPRSVNTTHRKIVWGSKFCYNRIVFH